MGEATARYAVVTGSNKGIGFEIVWRLASAGIKVVLTTKDEKEGLHALETFKVSGLSDLGVFYSLDVTDAASVASLTDFIKSKLGKLDILVNNAGIAGAIFKENDILISSVINRGNVGNGWAKGVLSDVDNLAEEKVDEVLKKFLEDFKEDSLESKGWPKIMRPYIVSKTSMNAYTRIIAKNFPSICINSVCPGYCKTDITNNTGFFTAEEGATDPVRIALLRNGSPSDLFCYQSEVSSF